MSISINHRNNCFDLVRFLAALAVLYSHSFPTSGLAEPVYFAGETAGSLGVFVFFAVSGYLVQQSWNRQPTKTAFIANRVLRIFPALIVCLLICAFVLVPIVSKLSIADYFLSFETYKFLYSNLIMLFVARYDALPGVFESNVFPKNINSSLWTIRYEVFMYFALLLICSVFKKSRVFIFVLFLLFSCAIWFYGQSVDLANPGDLLWRLGMLGMDGRILKLAPFFLVGAVIAYLPKRFLSFNAALLAIAVTILFRNSPNGIVVLWFSLPYCLIVFAHSSSQTLNNFGRYGDFSYGIYLYAFPVQQTLSYYEISTQNWLEGVLITFFATLMLAIFSWKIVESPFLKLRMKLSIFNTPVSIPSNNSRKSI